MPPSSVSVFPQRRRIARCSSEAAMPWRSSSSSRIVLRSLSGGCVSTARPLAVGKRGPHVSGLVLELTVRPSHRLPARGDNALGRVGRYPVVSKLPAVPIRPVDMPGEGWRVGVELRADVVEVVCVGHGGDGGRHDVPAVAMPNDLQHRIRRVRSADQGDVGARPAPCFAEGVARRRIFTRRAGAQFVHRHRAVAGDRDGGDLAALDRVPVGCQALLWALRGDEPARRGVGVAPGKDPLRVFELTPQVLPDRSRDRPRASRRPGASRCLRDGRG